MEKHGEGPGEVHGEEKGGMEKESEKGKEKEEGGEMAQPHQTESEDQHSFSQTTTSGSRHEQSSTGISPLPTPHHRHARSISSQATRSGRPSTSSASVRTFPYVNTSASCYHANPLDCFLAFTATHTLHNTTTHTTQHHQTGTALSFQHSATTTAAKRHPTASPVLEEGGSR